MANQRVVLGSGSASHPRLEAPSHLRAASRRALEQSYGHPSLAIQPWSPSKAPPRTLVSLALPWPGVVACAFVMGMAAAQVIQSAVNELLGPERLLEVDLQPHRASLQPHVHVASSLHTLCSQPAR